MREIKLTNSDLVALVDDEDFEYLSKFPWHLSQYGYAERKRNKSHDQTLPRTIRMNREIMKVLKDKTVYVDHKNHNKLDNQKENLRVCKNSENQQNLLPGARKTENTTSIYKGVIRREDGVYDAKITKDRKIYYIGAFESEKDAGLAYDQMARYLFGEFCCLNFTDEIVALVDIDKVLNPKKYTTSKYVGVNYDKERNCWQARVKYNKKKLFFKRFNSEVEAAIARNKYIVENDLPIKLNVIEGCEVE